jgi:mRNA interferase MazF
LAKKSGSNFVPERGDAVWLSFDPHAGHEQGGRRPAVILSPSAYNRVSGLAIAAPITSRVKNYPFEVPLPAGAAVSGVILIDQVKNIDWKARDAVRIGVLPAMTVTEALLKLAVLFKP